jgi:hypothetical protein
VCCGTKRLVQIRCPSDCVWLVSARQHPPAIVVRQQERDVAQLVQVMRDFTERQTQLFFLIATFLIRYQPPQLQALVDEDVADGAAALAATFETASRGVIYEHRPASLSAERLMAALKAVLVEAGRGLGSAFERDAVAVLRRVAAASTEFRTQEPHSRCAFLDLLGRAISREPESKEEAEPAADATPPRLILP